MTALDSARARPGWRFWFLWMLASLGGVIVYMIVVSPILNAFVPGSSDSAGPDVPAWEMIMIISAVGQMALGAAIGLAQWLVLRRVLSRMGWWVLASLVGYSIGMLAPWMVNRIEAGWMTGLVFFLIYGAGLGLAQWIVLRTHFQRAVWWVALIIAAWELAWALPRLAQITGVYVEPFDLLAAFLVPVAAAGGGIIWLMRRSGAPTLDSGSAKI